MAAGPSIDLPGWITSLSKSQVSEMARRWISRWRRFAPGH